MSQRAFADRLLDEIEEEFAFGPVLPLYMFAWSLAGLGMDRSVPQFVVTCRQAFDVFVSKHPDLALVWVRWPIDVTQARVVAPGTPIDLDADPDAPVDTPLLALTDPSDLPA